MQKQILARSPRLPLRSMSGFFGREGRTYIVVLITPIIPVSIAMTSYLLIAPRSVIVAMAIVLLLLLLLLLVVVRIRVALLVIVVSIPALSAAGRRARVVVIILLSLLITAVVRHARVCNT